MRAWLICPTPHPCDLNFNLLFLNKYCFNFVLKLASEGDFLNSSSKLFHWFIVLGKNEFLNVDSLVGGCLMLFLFLRLYPVSMGGGSKILRYAGLIPVLIL